MHDMGEKYGGDGGSLLQLDCSICCLNTKPIYSAFYPTCCCWLVPLCICSCTMAITNAMRRRTGTTTSKMKRRRLGYEPW